MLSSHPFFAGDTLHRTVFPDHDSNTPESSALYCPAFIEIGTSFALFDLALFLAPVRCTPEDSLCIHKDMRSKDSIELYRETIKEGISQEYEGTRLDGWWGAYEKAGLELVVEMRDCCDC